MNEVKVSCWGGWARNLGKGEVQWAWRKEEGGRREEVSAQPGGRQREGMCRGLSVMPGS